MRLNTSFILPSAREQIDSTKVLILYPTWTGDRATPLTIDRTVSNLTYNLLYGSEGLHILASQPLLC